MIFQIQQRPIFLNNNFNQHILNLLEIDSIDRYHLNPSRLHGLSADRPEYRSGRTADVFYFTAEAINPIKIMANHLQQPAESDRRILDHL